MFCYISVSGRIVLLTLVTVVYLPHSCWEASGKMISSSLCPWPCHWPFVFLHCFSLPSQLRNKWAIPICSTAHGCCSLLLLPMIFFILLKLPALTWALLKPLKVQLLNAESCILEVFLHSAGALYTQTLLPASSPLTEVLLWHLAVGGQAVSWGFPAPWTCTPASPLCWGYGPCLIHSRLWFLSHWALFMFSTYL